MLADPLVIKSPDLGAASAITVVETNSYALIDAGPGRSVRVCNPATFYGQNCARPATLTISHSVSNENKPVKTNRSLIRLDFSLENSSGQELKAYAYAVIGAPEGTSLAAPMGDPITASECGLALAQALIGALGTSSTAATLSSTKITRVLAGEP